MTNLKKCPRSTQQELNGSPIEFALVGSATSPRVFHGHEIHGMTEQDFFVADFFEVSRTQIQNIIDKGRSRSLEGFGLPVPVVKAILNNFHSWRK